MKDGWHKILGYEIYVENNIVKRGVLHKSELNIVPGYVYRKIGTGWSRESLGITVNAFIGGVRRGTIDLL